MRVLHVMHNAGIGGISSYTEALFAELERRGHTNVVAQWGTPIASPGLELRRIVALPGDAPGSDDRAQEKALEQLLRADAVDVATLHILVGERLGTLLLRSVPTAYFAHEYGAFCPSGARVYLRNDTVCRIEGAPDVRCLVNAYVQRCNTRRPGRLLGRYRATQEAKSWVRSADAIICDSRYVALQHERNGFSGAAMHVLPSPVRIPEIVARRPTARSSVLYVGRITPQKGLAHLIEAMALVPGVPLAIAGDGYERPTLERLVSTLGLGDRVRFMGSLSSEDVSRLYDEASVVCVPSVWPEPWGMVGPEAMAHGVPVVASNVGGIPEWLRDGETGYLVPPGNASAIAARLRDLLDRPEVASRFGEAARRIAAADFGIESHVDALLGLLQGMTARGAHRGTSWSPGILRG